MKKVVLLLGACCFWLATVATAGEFKHEQTEASSNHMTAYEMSQNASIDDGIDPDPWALYMGAMLGGFGLKVDSITGVSQNNLVLGGLVQVGLHINKYLSTEVRFGLTSKGKTSYSSIKSGTTTLAGVPLSISHKVDSFITYLIKPTIPISSDLGFYVALGGTTAQITVGDSFGTSVSKSKSGFSFGGGVNWYPSDSIRVETDLIDYWSGVAFDSTIRSSMWGLTSSINMAF